jgi:hypothetical protein
VDQEPQSEDAEGRRGRNLNAVWLKELVWANARRFLESPGEVLERVREQIGGADDTGKLEARHKDLAGRLQAGPSPSSSGARPEDGRTEIQVLYRFGPPTTFEGRPGQSSVESFKNGNRS